METSDKLNAAAPAGSPSSSPKKECSVKSSEHQHHAPYNKLLFARSYDDITKSWKHEKKKKKKKKSPSRWKESKESCFSLSDGNLDFCRHQIRRDERIEATSHLKEDNECWCGGRDDKFMDNKKYPAHGNGRMMKNNNPELPKEITLVKAAAKKGEVGEAILSSDGDMRPYYGICLARPWSRGSGGDGEKENKTRSKISVSDVEKEEKMHQKNEERKLVALAIDTAVAVQSAKAAKDSTTIEVLDKGGDNISLDVIDDVTMRPNNIVVTGETKKKNDKKLYSSNREEEEEECNLINSLFAEIYIPEQTSFHTITPVEQMEKGILTLSLLQQKEKKSSRQQRIFTLKKKSTAVVSSLTQNDNDTTSHETNTTVVKTENSEDTILSKSATEFFNKYESIRQLRLLTSVYPPPPPPSRNPRVKPPPPPPPSRRGNHSACNQQQLHHHPCLYNTATSQKQKNEPKLISASRLLKPTTNESKNIASNTTSVPPPPPPPRRRRRSSSASCSYTASVVAASLGSSAYRSNSHSSLKYRVPPRTRSQQLRRSQSSDGAPSIHQEMKS